MIRTNKSRNGTTVMVRDTRTDDLSADITAEEICVALTEDSENYQHIYFYPKTDATVLDRIDGMIAVLQAIRGYAEEMRK